MYTHIETNEHSKQTQQKPFSIERSISLAIWVLLCRRNGSQYPHLKKKKNDVLEALFVVIART